MSSKARKSLCPWVTCDKCQATLAQKDTSVHEQNCPPVEPWNHGFIKNGVFYTAIETYKSPEFPKNISTRETHNLIYFSELAMQLCEISIGAPVLVCNKENVVIKKAWPMNEKNLNAALLTKNAMELDKLEGSVKIEKLKSTPLIAQEIIIELVGKNRVKELSSELKVLIKNYNHNKIFAIGNRIRVPFYGKNLIYKILDIKTEENLADEFSMLDISNNKNVPLYLALYSTKLTFLENDEQKKETEKQQNHRLECIGGYTNLIEDLKAELNIGLGKFGKMENCHTGKGILLYGSQGVGKSTISEILLSKVEAHVVKIIASDIYSKNSQDKGSVLTKLFKEAFDKAPSIIFIEDIDLLCPKKSSSASEHILATLTTLLDSLQDSDKSVMVLALTSKPDSVDPSLRRPGRIDEEFEMPVPTRQIRKEILIKIIENISHSLEEEDIEQISFVTHGFVGADLQGLCTRARKNAIKTKSRSGAEFNSNEVIVSREDFSSALKVVRPSAMKEVLVDVPNVKWTDIGGQKDLKLKLQQAVEWPLKHSKDFTRLGIVPPKGVLMFGPPGCSKTMIAKALATESKLNFLNIKGPELFSKWVGDSEKAVRELFRKAQQVSPSIIFIDEIDALGAERSTASNSAGSNVQERILAQLLTELDGVTTLKDVTLVAATNRPDRIDKALLRPGRFDRLIYVPLPDTETRMEIFSIKFRNMPVSKDVILKDLVDLTEGYSGAEIGAICQEAGVKALEENLNAVEVTKEHFRVALSIVVPRTDQDLLRMYDRYVKAQSIM